MPFIPHYFPPFLVDMVIELNSQHLRHLTWNIQYIFTENTEKCGVIGRT